MLASVIESGWQPAGARLTPMRLSVAKKSYVTRHLAAHLDLDRRGFHLETATTPCAGDVVLVRVVDAPGGQVLEAPDGRGQHLYPGDEVLVAYGSRALADVEGEVPGDLGPIELLAPAGLVGRCAGVPLARFEPLGLLADDAGVVNMTRFSPFHVGSHPSMDRLARPRVVAVAAGRSTARKQLLEQRSVAAASLVLGLTRGGYRVAAGKASGSAAVDATGTFHDSGAPVVLDFTDFGYASTYHLDDDDLARLVGSLILELCVSAGDAIVVEVGDGLDHEQTRELLMHPLFADLVDTVVLVTPEGVQIAGSESLTQVTTGVASPAVAEAEDLRDPVAARRVVERLGS